MKETEPGVLLPAENVAEVVAPTVAPLVLKVDSEPWPGAVKHDWVRNAVLISAPFWQPKVKEIRDVPPDLLAAGIDLAIKGIVSLIREATK